MDKNVFRLIEKKYKEGITLITPTGDRQEAFSRCEKYISEQSVKPNQWIVVDDGNKETDYRLNQHYLRKQPIHDKAKSLTTNILHALPHIEYDYIIIIEDDDYYGPMYIERMVIRLSGKYDLVGEGCAKYYNVKFRKYRVNNNRQRASFCQTALRSKALPALYTSCLKEGSSFIDSRLWDKNISKNVFCDSTNVIGIKGMPGRLGIGSGHRPSKAYFDDKDLKTLKRWLPAESVEYYAAFFKPKLKQ